MTRAISNKIKIYNLILILFICLYHCDAKFYLGMSNLPYILGSFGLSFFFMSSGFFMYRGMTAENRRARVLKRFKSLLLPYLFWNLVFFLYYFISDKYFRNVPVKSVLYRVLFQPYNEVLWYLFTLFVFSLLAGLVFFCLKKPLTAAVFMILLIISVILVTIVFADEVVAGISIGWWIVKVFPYAPMYYMGGIIGMYFEKKLHTSIKYSWIFAILALGFMYCKHNYDYILILGWALLFFAPIVFWLAIPEKIFGYGQKIIDFLCNPSFFIYEFQLMAFWIWYDIFDSFIVNKKMLDLSVFFTAIIFMYLVFYASKVIAPHILGIATGFRNGKPISLSKKK